MKNFLKVLYKEYLKRYKPYVFMKKIGVNFVPGEIHLYGSQTWGSEPWLITLGKNVYLTAGVKFITHDGGTLLFRSQVPDLEITKPITIGDNVYVGNNVMILPGVHIGNNVVIGAGAVVTKDILDNSVVAGVPAKKIKNIDDYFEKLKRESIHLGHLKGKEKDDALKKFYHYEGKSKGIYF